MSSNTVCKNVSRVSTSIDCKEVDLDQKHSRSVTTIDSKYIGKCYNFSCPHCDGEILVQWHEVNCKYFRHGVYSQGPQMGDPINPHETKENIEKLHDAKMIWGCGKPISMTADNKQVFTCDYC